MMNSGVLSQEEIDALLRGAEIPEGDTENELDYSHLDFTDMEKDVIGEISNISMGTAATTLSTLLGRKVDITTPQVSVTSRSDIEKDHPAYFVVVDVKYTAGLEGNNVLIIHQKDVAVIVDLMMGGDGTAPPVDLTELHFSAISEAMNQMMGSASTSMATMLNKKIDISPPDLNYINLATEKLEYPIGDPIVKVSFRMVIEGLVDSELMQIYPIPFAKMLVRGLIGDPSEPGMGAEEIPVSTAMPEVPGMMPEAPGMMPGAPGMMPGAPGMMPGAPGMMPGAPGMMPGAPGMMPGAPGMMPGAPGMMPGAPGMMPGAPGMMPGAPGMMPGAPGMMPGAPGMMPGAPGMMPGAPGMMPGAPGMMPGAPGMMPGAPSGMGSYPGWGYPPPAYGNYPPSPSPMPVPPPVPVQPVQFTPLQEQATGKDLTNLGLIMDVPLQVTVELGKAKKTIRDILELGPGSVIELDKLAGEPVDILVNGKLVAKGEVVVIDENFGVRITDIVQPMERILNLQ
ncbi:flagellar motor switch phosphatase FliY [Heliophilum fasciatum]|uniref:Flagellar motor switch protein FliN/FliY n=1 Tax=Heliophilum fasciatum TaxID=35700 RepID=A0A4R2RND2_9FIRM|nr:flagellar motor switch phosphatase FliY [Heliophilum fasciatum]MCW2277932.1 flagellar motor switch protein FliN/FliY [Heliophilum fasciatum]TCP64498.1 flagellar motor switch protein FliN/FliY [Heliophilum fasciatum]